MELTGRACHTGPADPRRAVAGSVGLVEALPLVFTGGWASGLNAYLVVLLAGLLGRYGGVDGVPATLQSTPVLVVSGVLFAVEFVVDKIPYLDSIWDGASTLVRPAVGAWLGALLAGQAGDMGQGWAAVLGGGTALASHSLKSGFRLAVNASPEPVTNVATSTTEDGLVAVVVLLATRHPWIAAGVAAAVLVAGTVAVVALWRRMARAVTSLRARLSRREQPAASCQAPSVQDVDRPREDQPHGDQRDR
jgi:hypothetical protein